MDFAHKAVIVTGSSSGIGRELAVAFAKRGAGVLVNYASSEQGARETLALIEKEGGKAIICQADVSKVADCDRMVRSCVDAFGRLDVLVNNAGCTSFVPFENLDAINEASWERIMGVNVKGTFYCCRAAAKAMQATGGGSIISLASIAGHRASGSSIPYCASKAAIIHMSRCLAKALGPDIRVNTISPGFIGETNWNDDKEDSQLRAIKEHAANTSVAKRTGIPKDITGAALFLASDASSFCTGIDILVDGGRGFYV